MKDPRAGMCPPSPRFRAAVAASIGLHIVLLAVPAMLWRALPHAPGSDADLDPGRRGADFMVVSLVDAPEPSVPPAQVAAPMTEPRPEVIPPRPREEPSVVEPAAGGISGESGGEADGSPDAVGAGGAGDEGAEGGTSAAYRPPRLLAGALPLTPQESESLPSPLEIPVRLRIGRDGRVTAVEPADPALSSGLREALERSARTMRFVPARLGAEPVDAWFAMTFIYRR